MTHVNRSFGFAALAAACVLLPAIAAAAPTALYVGGVGLGLEIPDDNPVGVSSSLTAVSGDTLLDTVPDGGGIVKNVEVVISMDHTWVGDLIMTLTSPEGTVLTLLDRPGADVDGEFGDNSNLERDEFIYFSDRAIVPAEFMGFGCDGTDSVVGVDCLGAFSPEEESTLLAGEDLLGTWTLTISDNAGGDIGVLNGWYIEIDFHPVPLPASGWLLATAGFGLMLVRRRRTAA
jgi:subtilisin-like proprotein convertase family protein